MFEVTEKIILVIDGGQFPLLRLEGGEFFGKVAFQQAALRRKAGPATRHSSAATRMAHFFGTGCENLKLPMLAGFDRGLEQQQRRADVSLGSFFQTDDSGGLARA